MIRKLLRSILAFLFRLLTHVEVKGVENIPEKGGAILATNHMSRLDPPLVFIFIERSDLTALVADKYKKYPVFSWILNAVNGIYINRESADFSALREARSFLKNGGMLGIAPEGTRSTTGQMLEAKTGVAYLADKAGVPIVPIAIMGTEDAVQKLLHLRRPKLRIQFGEPFHLPPLVRNNRSASLKQNTDEIMCRIAAMLKPRYWGAYQDQPCVQQASNQTP